MQNGVEHPVRPLHASSGQLPNSLEDCVAVAVLFGQDRQDDRRRGSGYQVLVDLHDFTRRAALTNSNSSVHSGIIYSSARYVNPQSGRPAAGGEIDVRRVALLGIGNGETLSEFAGLNELTSSRVLGRLLYAVAGASFKPSSQDPRDLREHRTSKKPLSAKLREQPHGDVPRIFYRRSSRNAP